MKWNATMASRAITHRKVFNGAVPTEVVINVEWYDGMIAFGELQRTGEEAATVCFKVLGGGGVYARSVFELDAASVTGRSASRFRLSWAKFLACFPSPYKPRRYGRRHVPMPCAVLADMTQYSATRSAWDTRKKRGWQNKGTYLWTNSTIAGSLRTNQRMFMKFMNEWINEWINK
jgi:hypothetical protein